MLKAAAVALLFCSLSLTRSEAQTPQGDTWPDAVKNGTYAGATLRAGIYKNADSTLSIVKMATGDLDGDGVTDAAVVFASHYGGGTGTFYSLAVVRNNHGRPQLVTERTLGDRITVTQVTIQLGRISVAYLTHGPNEGLCCATLPVDSTFVLRQGRLGTDAPSTAVNRDDTAPDGARMRTVLRDAEVAQEAYFAEHARYATTLPSMRLPRGVTLEIIEASPHGWSGMAKDAAFPRLTCYTYVGIADSPHKGMPKGLPSCWP